MICLWNFVLLLLLTSSLDSFRIQHKNGVCRLISSTFATSEKSSISRRRRRVVKDLSPSQYSPPPSMLPYSALKMMKSMTLSNLTKEIGLPANKTLDEDLFSIGYMHMGWISNVKGLDGELKMHLVSNLIDDSFLNNDTMIYLRSPRGVTLKPFKVLHSKFHKKTIHVLKLKGLADVDLASTLKRHAVYVKQTDVPPLAEDEFLERHILGMHVYVNTSEGVEHMPFGRVTRAYTPEDLCRTKALAEIMHGIIEIQRFDNGRFTMIPFTDEFIPVMDIPKRMMVIEPIVGQLNITFADPKRRKRAKQSREMLKKSSSSSSSSSNDEDAEEEGDGSNPFMIPAKVKENAANNRQKPAVPKVVVPGVLTKTEKRRQRAERAAARRAEEKRNRTAKSSETSMNNSAVI